ncbi:unnamed protein product [Owenia fusiformis]|uniref:Disease resistance R13L4/SHOC-2-like LRR domain-containing protein n=1 Tax=Owenia fusiformis TaxID=6347 RepID=A0A8J1XY35_OWEFU|nr:unnamed protein product [Owenia fusiformis]
MGTRLKQRGVPTLQPIIRTNITEVDVGERPKLRRRVKGAGPLGGKRGAIRTVSATSNSTLGTTSPMQSPSPSSDIINGDVELEGQDVLFTNIPSGREKSANRRKELEERLPSRKINELTLKMVLEGSQESDLNKIYEVDVSGVNIAKIQNLNRLKKLRVLNLSSNYIEKIENLYDNTDLRELKLYDNDITTLGLLGLTDLKELCHLQLQHNKIKSIGRNLCKLRKLKILRIDSNYILKLEPGEFAGCPALTSLDISNNRIDNIAALNSLPNLEELVCVNNRLRTVPDLQRCKKLIDVDLSANRLTDVSGLKGLPCLSVVHISHNNLSSVKGLGKLKNLRELNIAHNRITDLQHIADQFPNLEILEISDNNLSQWKHMKNLSTLEWLVELYISGNSLCKTDKPYSHTDVQEILPHLEILDGAHLKKSVSQPRGATPLMRPMSANSVVSARLVESQLKSLEAEIGTFESTFAEKFDALKMSFDTLPVEPPPSSRMSGAGSRLSTASSLDRPVSRCSSRSRIKDAKSFAEQHFN